MFASHNFNALFSLFSPITSLEEDDDLLVYTREGETFEDLERYRRLVGKLNYLIVTSPDITHSVIVVSQYMSAQTVDHWVVVEHILCYFKGASDVVFYIVIMGITKLSTFLTQIGQDLRKTRGPLRGSLKECNISRHRLTLKSGTIIPIPLLNSRVTKEGTLQ